MINLKFVPLNEIKRLQKKIKNPVLISQLLADIFRLSTLSMIMEAGSGHIGTSFSSMEIITWLWTQEMRLPNSDQAGSDYFFSSKGHDAPALYSVLIGLEKLDYKYIHKFRRLGGLPGHPDVKTPFILTNTGSLGMGISKASGLALARRRQKKTGRIFVLLGDGELQEGQIWESLQPAANKKLAEITVIVDHNKIQSDISVKDTSDLGDLEKKFQSFGWAVARCDGHDFKSLKKVFADFSRIKNKPKVLIADTVKGRGVSFMEKLSVDGLYKFHSGAPKAEDYEIAFEEIANRVGAKLDSLKLEPLKFETKGIPDRSVAVNQEKLVAAYGDELLKLARRHKNIIGLDADLAIDTGLLKFKQAFPDRYVECGIAEQDMVSMAGGLALEGMLPLVHSFACFLSTRANEQIYNNATEGTKIIYAGSLAGLIPAAPGHSHQSLRDISILGSIPGLTLIEPGNEQETRLALRWAVEKNKFSTYIRLVSVPCSIPYQLPANYKLTIGRGVKLTDGQDAVIFAYGPVMLGEAVRAAQLLEKEGIGLTVFNLPWLNEIDEQWLKENSRGYKAILTLDDHYVKLGQGAMIAEALAKIGNSQKVTRLGLGKVPACGQAGEVLAFHKLDAFSIAQAVRESSKK
jgi:transketolase